MGFAGGAAFAKTRAAPSSAGKRLRSCAVKGLVPNCWLYSPCEIMADFDGDKKADVAVLVSRGEKGAKGVAFLFANGRCAVAGAGKEPNNEEQDLGWIAHWSLSPDAPAGSKGAALLLLKAEDSARVLYWDGKRARVRTDGE